MAKPQNKPARVPIAVGSNSAHQLRPISTSGIPQQTSPQEVLESLVGGFQFLAEDATSNTTGLRSPQLGALHAVLGYWTTAPRTSALVVMPTGTGKTETMLAIYAASQLPLLLVVVPSDALRQQVAAKFESYGLLQSIGVVSDSALTPIVGRIEHRINSADEARAFSAACNVIVTTPSALMASSGDVRDALYERCSHLFIDEAHHVAADTWKEIKNHFPTNRVVQFTATPFREDGQHLDGRLVYAFPLREAQRQGYFSKIKYKSVVDFDDADRMIAIEAVNSLRADLAAGHDHVLMARVKRTGRAAEVLAIYEEIASDLNPIVLHSTLPARTQRESRKALNERNTRIVVCVDMLGEGFDLPSLKVAAIHDPHKSIGITLQFVGRFARVKDSVGDATVVVGRPSGTYDWNLRRLYSENADWDAIIEDLSEYAVAGQEANSEFEQGFSDLPDQVAMQSLVPKMSTVVYRTDCDDWSPESVLDVHSEEELLTFPLAVNLRDRVLWFVTEDRSAVRWGDVETVEDISYGLHILYWDVDRQLLYINGSSNDGMYHDLAAAVCGDSVEQITGEAVYRTMAHVHRLVPTNVGVLDVRRSNRRFSMHVGADVTEGFPVAEAQTKSKTNIFANGFENGDRVGIGASLKGRIWSHRVATTIKHWVDWCDHVGTKLIDSTISIDGIMANFIRPQILDDRPELVPLGVEWPLAVLGNTSEETHIRFGEAKWPLIDVDLRITEFSLAGPLQFEISTPVGTCRYNCTFSNGRMTFAAIDTDPLIGNRRAESSATDFLNIRGLNFFFEQDAVVVPPAMLLRPTRALPAYDADALVALDWTGIDLHKESQGKNKAADSIQFRMIEHVKTMADWNIIIDDDGSGEIADIVAIKAGDETLDVLMVHCKYSSEDTPGSRVGDLYEVCGQSQKSAYWRRNVESFFENLIRREKHRLTRIGRSGIEIGDANALYLMQDRSRFLRPNFTVAIAQPGVSKQNISRQQLDLLGTTELFITETADSLLTIFTSP